MTAAADFRALAALAEAAPADWSVPHWLARDFIDMQANSLASPGQPRRLLRGYVVYTPDGALAPAGSRVALRWGRKDKTK